MVLEAAEGAEAAQSHAEAIVLPTVLGPRDAAPRQGRSAIAGKNVEGGCLLAPGGGDNAMASLGLGMAVGDVSISLGTSGVAAAISENPTYDLTGAVSGFATAPGTTCRWPAPSTVRASSTPAAPPSAWITTNWPSWPSPRSREPAASPWCRISTANARRTARMPPPPSPA